MQKSRGAKSRADPLQAHHPSHVSSYVESPRRDGSLHRGRIEHNAEIRRRSRVRETEPPRSNSSSVCQKWIRWLPSGTSSSVMPRGILSIEAFIPFTIVAICASDTDAVAQSRRSLHLCRGENDSCILNPLHLKPGEV